MKMMPRGKSDWVVGRLHGKTHQGSTRQRRDECPSGKEETRRNWTDKVMDKAYLIEFT